MFKDERKFVILALLSYQSPNQCFKLFIQNSGQQAKIVFHKKEEILKNIN